MWWRTKETIITAARAHLLVPNLLAKVNIAREGLAFQSLLQEDLTWTA